MWISEKVNKMNSLTEKWEMKWSLEPSVAVELSILLTLQKRTTIANGLNHLPFKRPDNMKLFHYSLLC